MFPILPQYKDFFAKNLLFYLYIGILMKVLHSSSIDKKIELWQNTVNL